MNSKKKLGQFFTPKSLVRLSLGLLEDEIGKFEIMDPMCGRGNMLQVAIECGAAPEKVFEMEIDKQVCEECQKNFFRSRIKNGNTFELWKDKKELYQRDLVLANPPYLRYQTTSGDSLMSAEVIRSSLFKIIDGLQELPEQERKMLEVVANNYKALADVWIPAWILCMAFTKKSGWLMIVLPEAWKSRDYSLEVIAFFLKNFQLYYIIEDIHRNWFEDAQVKTNILIAKKRKKVKELFQTTNDFFYTIKVDKQINEIVERNRLQVSTLVAGLTKYSKRIKHMDNSLNHMNSNREVISSFFQECGIETNFRFITDNSNYGIEVGQGLRTGANNFFYVESLAEREDYEIVGLHDCWGLEPINVERRYLKTAIRNQSDLSECISTKDIVTKWRILQIDDELHIGNELKEYIKTAGKVPVLVKGERKLVMELSAVKTNTVWYMLPKLRQRHIPQIFVPRINNKDILFFHNHRKDVIDANFSTIWFKEGYSGNCYAVLAIFNSCWVRFQLEKDAVVMGGGALKVEATHIKKVILPLFDKEGMAQMNSYGIRLCTETNLYSVKKEIDYYILNRILQGEEAYRRIMTYIERKTGERNRTG